MCSDQARTYDRNNCIVFLKTKEAFGGLSNMAGGFPLRVNGIRIFTSEALYQACRFPHLPDVQRIVLGEPSPMTSKMKSKPHRQNSRPDWDQVRVRVMRWCLRVKLVQNWKTFGYLLLATDDKPIVEESRKDDFWGANPVDERTLVGMNVLGRLLMELREEFKSDRRDALLRVEPLEISDFLLMGQPIPVIEALAQDSKRNVPHTDISATRVGQPSQLDQPTTLDAETVSVPMHEVNEQIPQTYANSYAAITDLKPYPAYKDSGLPWLGRVPGHWKMLRGKFLFRCKKELNTDRVHKNVLSLTLRGVVNNDPDNPEGLVPKDYGTYQFFSKGDLVFKLIDLENLRTSRVGLVHQDGIMSSAYVRLVPTHGGLQRFFYQQYFDLYQRGVFNQLGAGVRSTLGSWDLLNLGIVTPPTEEQAAIVRFLDNATHRLDKAIRAKRKTIALLIEQKQAIIHRAVTCGLAPDVPLKDSGIPWLGEIPQHWEVLPLKRCSIVISKGTTPSTEGQEILEEGPIRFIKAESISGGVIINKPRAFIDQETHNVLRRSQLREHDVLFVIAGATLGKIAIVRESHLPANTNQAVAFIRPNRRVTPEFLAIWLQSSRIKEQIWLNAVQSAQPNLSMGSLGDFPVPLPPIAEQAIVVERLDAELRLPNAAIQRIEREILLLREYRTRLIADVVTGKLDVREIAARLPVVAGAPTDVLEDAVFEETDDELAEEEV